MTLQFKVIMQSINRNDINEPVAGSIGYLAAKFTFTEDWDGLVKTAIFTSSTNESYSVVLANDACEVPHEVIKMGKMKVGVRGNNGEGKTIRITTSPKEVEIKASGILTGENPRPPTADEYSQVVALMQQQSVDASRAETAQLEAEKAAEDAQETYGFLAAEVEEQLGNIETAGNAKKDEINAAGAVLYSPQALTEEQKLQSRTNIGAAADADLTAHKDNLSAHPWLFRSKNDLITATKSGDSLISADDSAGGWVKGLTVYGKSVQNGTPDPSAPVPMNGVSGNLEVRGKNLIPYPYTENTKTYNGIAWTVNSDGTVTANGTATEESSYAVSLWRSQKLPVGVYKVSGCPTGGTSSTYRTNPSFRLGGTVILDSFDYGTGVTANLPNGCDQFYMTLRIKSGVTVTNLTFKPQLELGSVATPYSPYIGATYISPDLGGIPLGATIPAAISSNPLLMSGVYHDGAKYWCGDTYEPAALVDGAWRSRALPRKINIAYNGAATENWTIYTPPENNRQAGYTIFRTNVSAEDRAINTRTLCNMAPYFPGGYASPVSGICQAFETLGLHWSIKVPNTIASNIDEWRAFIANTPIELQYIHSAPVATLSDPIFIDAPKGTLNLYHTSEIQPYIAVDYPLDIKAYVDNKINEVIAAIFELSAT